MDETHADVREDTLQVFLSMIECNNIDDARHVLEVLAVH